MKEATTKRVQVTEQICKQIRLMRAGGANQTEIGALLGINPSTVSRIEKAGFSLEKYLETKKIAREKEKQAKEQPKIELVYDESIAEEYRREQEAKKAAEEQVPGQMRMDLAQAEKQEMNEQTKLMRFQAEMTSRTIKAIGECAITLCTKIDRLNDTLSMILRAVRKE